MIEFERTTLEKNVERDIITGLIINKEFTQKIQKIYRPEFFKVKYVRMTADWCLDYFKKYDKTPGKDIKSILESKKDLIRDESTFKMIETFLESISDQYVNENFNVDYHVDKAVKFFKNVALDIHIEQVKAAQLNQNYEKADAIIADYKKTEKNINMGIDVWTDVEASIDAIRGELDASYLFRFPGDLGKLIRAFKRGDFIAFVGPGKRGKCVEMYSEILISDGSIKTIEEIVKSKIENVVTLNTDTMLFEDRKAFDFFDNGIKQVYKVKTKTSRSVKVTEEHPFLTFNGWKSLSELKPGDRIASSKKIDFFGKKNIPESHVKIIAYLLADGGLTQVTPSFTKKDSVVVDDMRVAVEDIGDCLTSKKVAGQYYISKGYGVPEKSNISELIDRYKIKRVKSIYKEIPDIIFTLKKIQVALFLNRLFTCDGSIWKDRKNIEISYNSGSKKMIGQIRHLLLRFGILSTTREKVIDGTFYYELIIRSKEYLTVFLDDIGFFSIKQDKADSFRGIINSKRSGLSFLDSFPNEMKDVIHGELQKFREKEKLSYKEFISYKPIKNFYKCRSYIGGVKRKILLNIQGIINSQILEMHLNSDIIWDEIIDITDAGLQQTYDISVEKYHNFISDDIVVHNSWMLIEIAAYASLQGLNILFVSMEMTEQQVLIRLHQRANGMLAPGETDGVGSKEIEVPTFDRNGNIYQKKEVRSEIDEYIVQKKMKDIHSLTNSNFKLVCGVSGSIKASEIQVILTNFEHYEQFIPDVILVDYPDILGPEFKGDTRDQINETWLRLRSISQEYNCLVAVISHSNKATYDRDIRQGDLSEDSRKLNHVTWAGAINQSQEDEDNGCIRISVVADRFKKFNKKKEVMVTRCLDVGGACLDSRIIKEEY